MILKLLAAFLVSIGAAESTVQPCDYSRALFKAISSSATYSEWARDGDTCTITWIANPKKPVIFEDLKAKQDATKLELKALKVKLDSGSLTKQEMDRLLHLILEVLGL